MSQSFPEEVPNYPDTMGSEVLNAAGSGKGLSQILDDYGLDITAIAAKLGTGAATPIAGSVLRGTDDGVSEWGPVDLTTDVTGLLPVGNLAGFNSASLRGLLTDETGVGSAVFADSPVLLTPTIASFAEANHDHEDDAGGGVLTGAALTATDGLLRDVHGYTYDGTDVFIDGVDQNNGDNTVDWSKPSGLKFVVVEVVGAGGGGGGAAATTASLSNGSGGGGGGYSLKKIAVGDLGSTEVVTVGAAGAANSGAAGGTGGTTSFGSHLQATGGNGGVTLAAGATEQAQPGGAGGVGSGGNINVAGQPGNHCIKFSAAVLRCIGGNGGSSVFGGGGRSGGGGGTSETITGGTGGAYGGGGGGSNNSGTQSAIAGGLGGAAIVKVYEYF